MACGWRSTISAPAIPALAYLKSAPFDKIKIDQSFVRGAIREDNRNAAIIKAIVTLADTLGMETTAEGVEHQDELPLIRELGCSHIQGFVYGKAMTRDMVFPFLSTNHSRTQAIGFKVSRSDRTKVIRFAKVRAGEDEIHAVVRDLSNSGVMIEFGNEVGARSFADIDLSVVEGQWLPAKVCWRSGSRMGISLDNLLDDEQVAQLSC